MTDAVKPERKVEPKPPPAPPKAQKLCGLGMRVTEEPPHRIVELIEGGAAKMSNKLLVGDHILKIAGKETKGLTMPQVRDLIVGPPGSVVTLCVNRKVDDQEQVFDIDLTREEIRTPRDNTPRNSSKSSTEALAGLTTSFSNFFN